MRVALASLIALACSACVADAPGPDALASIGNPAQLAQSVGPQQALASLPAEAGTVIAVIERRTGDLVAQDIVLKAEPPFEGENKIAISIGAYGAGGPGLGPQLIPPPSSSIAAEMAKELPGMAMQTSVAMAQNGYGPFGYAAGTAGGRSCVYAWQFVRGKTGFGPAGKNHSVSVRVRLCRQRTTIAALVDTVGALRINSVAAAAAAAAPAGVFVGATGGDALDVAQAMR